MINLLARLFDIITDIIIVVFCYGMVALAFFVLFLVFPLMLSAGIVRFIKWLF